MRIFDKDRRITLADKSDEQLFAPEVEYYSKNNQYHVDLFDRHIINVYRRINVQILLTKACNFKCPFCIEREEMPLGKVNNKSYWLHWYVREILTQYKNQGIIPTVSITGGEPTLFAEKLHQILDIIREFMVIPNGIEYVNINTNGTNLRALEDFPWLRVNVSRHHYAVDRNMEIFGKPFTAIKTDQLETANLQCVLMKDYIDSIEEMKRYMNVYGMAKGFSFRGLTTLDEQKGYKAEVAFTKERVVDVKTLLDEIAKDPEFEFIQQKIGDHYIYELYKHHGKVFRVVYSNFDWLRQVEAKERKRGDVFSRATIIHPNAVYSGWTYDLNLIHARS